MTSTIISILVVLVLASAAPLNSILIRQQKLRDISARKPVVQAASWWSMRLYQTGKFSDKAGSLKLSRFEIALRRAIAAEYIDFGRWCLIWHTSSKLGKVECSRDLSKALRKAGISAAILGGLSDRSPHMQISDDKVEVTYLDTNVKLIHPLGASADTDSMLRFTEDCGHFYDLTTIWKND